MPAPRILIENQNALGRNVEQVSLDTNRISIHRESDERFENAIAISSRGLWVDITQWVSYASAFTATAKLALWLGLAPGVAWAVFGLPPMLLAISLISTINERPKLRVSASVRLLLIFIGAAIAVL
jgi:hypothetical protein